jgi:glutamate/tyrosine decarboxylase-like PLP-dependent enzyme
MARLPKQGMPWAEIERAMDEARRGDADWRRGRIGVYIHYAGDDVLEIAKRAYLKFFSENGLGPQAFPSLARLQSDVIAMTLELLHAGADARGTVTTGGTESIFLAVKAARDCARKLRPTIARPVIVAPRSAHPAFNKAAHFLDMEVVRIPLAADFRADVAAMEDATTPETVMLVGSSPAFPHGVIDPIAELADLAARRDIWLHVDACVGGYIAPFARRLGADIPPFDFALPGVTSISADLHKYGYAAKGASTVLYRDEDAFRHQAYVFDDWSRGHYGTETLVGTRPGGAIAAAWAVMNFLGESGYLEKTKRVLATRRAIEQGVRELGLEVWGKPELSILSFGARHFDIFAVGDRLMQRGWYVSRLAEPPGIHLMLNLTHEPIVTEYLADLRIAVEEVSGADLSATDRAVSY